MPLDKKQIALSVGGILAGLSLTYILWKRSQDAAAASASAAATAAAQEQQSQEIDYSSAASGLSSAGGGGGIVNNYSDTAPTQTATASGDDDASDVSSIVNQILGAANGTLPSIPGNALIPEVDINDASTALTGIDTSAAEILGYAPAGTVSTTTSTGQTYGATSSPTSGGNSNPDDLAPVTTPPLGTVYGTPASNLGATPRVKLSSSLVN